MVGENQFDLKYLEQKKERRKDPVYFMSPASGSSSTLAKSLVPQKCINLICAPQVVVDLAILGLSYCCELD